VLHRQIFQSECEPFVVAAEASQRPRDRRDRFFPRTLVITVQSSLVWRRFFFDAEPYGARPTACAETRSGQNSQGWEITFVALATPYVTIVQQIMPHQSRPLNYPKHILK